MNYTDLYGVEYSEDKKTLLKFSKEQTLYVIPEGTVAISASAFKDCDKLSKLCIPVSLKTVESGAFNGCKHLTSIEYAGTLRDWLLMNWGASIECAHSIQFNGVIIKDIVIPEDIVEIKQNAFYYCNSIQSLKCNNRLTAIGESAFNKCTSLSGDLILPESLKSIDTYAFFCTNVCNVTLPSTLEKIGDGSFSACYSLRSFSMPENDKYYVTDGRAIVRKAHTTQIGKNTVNRPNTIFAFAGAGVTEPYVIPTSVMNFAYDTFCFNSLGKGGIWIKHEMDLIPDGAVRKATGKIYVLPKLKRKFYYNDLKGLIEEKFDQEYAFKSDNHTITAVANNPFRVLGVYANASQKEITANARKIKRYLEVGKDVEFPTDLNFILPPLKRTEEMVDKALADITTAEGKWKNALFWFVSNDNIDEIALAHLQANNIEKAKEIWKNKYTWNSQLNLSSLYLLYSDIDSSASAIYLLYDGKDPFVKDILKDCHNVDREINYEDFLRCVLSDYTEDDVYHGELESTYFEGLLIDVDLVDLRAMYNGNNIRLNIKLERYYQDLVNNAIAAAKNVNPKDTAAAHKSMDDLMGSSRWIDEYKVYFGEDNKNAELLSDNYANQLLQSAINFYNAATDDYDEEGNVIAGIASYYAGFAELYATSQIRKDRCEKNIEILDRNAERIPPKALLPEKDKLEEILASYIKSPETVAQAYALLKDCAPIICSIKEYKEKHRYGDGQGVGKLLDNLSTGIVAVALNKLVAEVNRSTKSNSNVYDAVRKAREVVMSMKEFPMMEDFRKDRFNPNSATLDNLYLKASPLGQIGLGILPNVAGTYPILNVSTDEEVWRACKKAVDYKRYLDLFDAPKHAEEAKQRLANLDDVEFAACKSKQNYEDYLKLFPQGKHQEEAESKINEFKGQEKKEKYAKVEKEVLKYLIFAFVLVIFNTVIYATCTSDTFQGWVIFSCIAYVVKLGYDTFTKYL